MLENAAQYRPRNPESSPLWNLFNIHYDSFEKKYEEQSKHHIFTGKIKKINNNCKNCPIKIEKEAI